MKKIRDGPSTLTTLSLLEYICHGLVTAITKGVNCLERKFSIVSYFFIATNYFLIFWEMISYIYENISTIIVTAVE